MTLTTIYTTLNCPGCKQLKARYDAQGRSYTEVVIGRDIDREAFQEAFPGVRQVPFVVEKEEE